MKDAHNIAPRLSPLLVLGHRGAIIDSAAFHQNSLRAFGEAVTAGDGFESDACVDKDGEIFLIHEAKYANATTGVEYCMAEHLDSASAAFVGTRRIDQLTTAGMRRLRLRDGSPIPTLREAVERIGAHKGKLIDIELKAYGVVEPVLRLVQDCVRAGIIAPDALMLSSFNHPALATVRAKAPHLRIGAIFMDGSLPTTPLFPWQPGSAGAYTALTVAALDDAVLRQIDPDYFIVPQEILTEATVQMIAAHYPRAQLMAWVFTEKDNLDMADLLARLKKLHPTGKIAAMMVDNPRVFKATLREAGWLSD
jgi:glycerophosphoryl diester phosphodiesterase